MNIFVWKLSKIAAQKKVFFFTFFGLLRFSVFFNGLFVPISWSRMSNIFRDSESLRKSIGKKWSQIWTFFFENCRKSPRKKKFFFLTFSLLRYRFFFTFFGLLRFSVFFNGLFALFLSFSFIVQQPILWLSALQTTISTLFAFRLHYYIITIFGKGGVTRHVWILQEGKPSIILLPEHI